jgi:2',3'-cyclic-nucleotide 2'-phosphodiesterase (5'-nucleotidase family)
MTVRRLALSLLLIAAGILPLVSCSTASPASAPPTTDSIQRVTPGAPKPATAAPPHKTIQLTILHTNDSRGYVDHCG